MTIDAVLSARPETSGLQQCSPLLGNRNQLFRISFVSKVARVPLFRDCFRMLGSCAKKGLLRSCIRISGSCVTHILKGKGQTLKGSLLLWCYEEVRE